MLKTDLHVHSLASGHAFNTIFELVAYAKTIGVETIAITDHGPSMVGAPHLGYFEVLNRIPKKIDGVNVMVGCEANIIDLDGNIDIPIEIQRSLDLVIIGLHQRTPYPKGTSIFENTTALIKAIRNNRVGIIAHPYRTIFPVDIEALSKAAHESRVALEVNLHHLSVCDEEELKQVGLMLEFVSRMNGKVVVSSDAHIAQEIGDDSILERLSFHIPTQIVLGLNGGKEEIKEYFG